MFTFLGKVVTRFWPLLLVAWLVLLGACRYFAPAWDEVTQAGDAAFLPEDAPSRRAERLFKEAFPNEFAGSNIVLIVSREGDDAGLREEDKKFLAAVLTPALKKLATDRQPVVARIRTPEDTGVGALLWSRDKRAALALVELTTTYLDYRNWAVVEAIEGLLARFRREQQVPPGLAISLTGSATAGRDMGLAELKSAHDIEVWTFAVVVALLLLTYRAPLLALLPLATVYIAVQIALDALALMAGAQVLSVSRDLRIFITVLAYGAGVDYCVFLIARYQEELDAGADVGSALAGAIGRVGGAVSASAATVICGIGMMAFARFGKIREAGLVIPFCLVLVLCAVLTFAPALLRLTRRWAFWPQGLTDPANGGSGGSPVARLLRRNPLPDFWGWVGPALVRRPGLIWLATVAIMTPFALVAVRNYNDVTYDPLSGLPETAPSVAGNRALERYFSPGLVEPITLLLQNNQVEFDSEKGIGLIRELTERLEAQKSSLGIADLRSVARPLGTTEAAKEALTKLPVPRGLADVMIRNRTVAYYVSHAGESKGHVTRIDLVLAVQPLSRQGLEYLDRIERSLEAEFPEGLRQGSQFVPSGPAATVRDLREVTRGDQTRVQTLVPIAVFLLLLIAFRRLAVALYLILSVLFSYLVTLGGTFVVFRLFERESFSGLDWKVPLFLFTILVAVGEDYNIFLMSRIEEEERTRGPIQGALHALVRTGRIISTCGFIMAGTFAALFAGSFLGMKELGFALAVGVLLDTLVIRPILVPTFWILLQRWHRGVANKTPGTAERPEVIVR